jgi:hypothetical protein
MLLGLLEKPDKPPVVSLDWGFPAVLLLVFDSLLP